MRRRGRGAGTGRARTGRAKTEVAKTGVAESGGAKTGDGGTGGATTGDAKPGGAETRGDAVRIVPGNGRELQVAPTRRKLFTKAMQQEFFEHLAATCNVTRSAAAVGIDWRTTYAHRMKDQLFREAWGRAIEQGYARLEAMQLERAERAQPFDIAGDKDVAPELDWDKAMALMREHKRSIAGIPKAGAPRKAVNMDEVRAAVIRKLKALGVRPPGDAGGERPKGG